MAVAIPPKVSKWFDVLVSIGAAIVIWGALNKIIHAPGADLWLKIGLGTESLIFLGYALIYMRYPAVEDNAVKVEGAAGTVTSPAVQAMENMLQQANITPEGLNKLSAGFQKLNDTVEKLSEIGDVVLATQEYTQKAKEAAMTLEGMKETYKNIATSAVSFSNASEGAKVFHEQIQVLTKNLSSLNTIYELELQESNNHLKTLNQFYGKMADISASMQNSVQDAQKAKEEIAALAHNLNKLNQVYGNMLTAMQVK
jgi:gliding motility-associated protein GldL